MSGVCVSTVSCTKIQYVGKVGKRLSPVCLAHYTRGRGLQYFKQFRTGLELHYNKVIHNSQCSNPESVQTCFNIFWAVHQSHATLLPL